MKSTAATKAKKIGTHHKKKKKPVIPYHRKPDNMDLDQWQAALRKQFAEQQVFTIENIGSEAVFSDYSVYNPLTGNSYKVAIRSNPREIKDGNNANFCSCYDFKTSGLGTCKHIEAVILKISKNRALTKTYNSQSYQPPYSSVYLKYSHEGRSVMLRIGTENSAKFQSLSKKYFHPNGTIKSTAYNSFDVFLVAARKIDAEFRCYDDALAYIFEVREKNRRKVWVWKNQKQLQNGLLSKYVKADLHPYQKEGISFAIQSGRSLIADEMGLGKTLQAVATSEVLKKEFGIQNVLIVCPTSLKYQWKSETEKFTDSSAHVIEGLQHKRRDQYLDESYFYKIVSHHTVGNDLEEINGADFDLYKEDFSPKTEEPQARKSRSRSTNVRQRISQRNK